MLCNFQTFHLLKWAIGIILQAYSTLYNINFRIFYNIKPNLTNLLQIHIFNVKKRQDFSSWRLRLTWFFRSCKAKGNMVLNRNPCANPLRSDIFHENHFLIAFKHQVYFPVGDCSFFVYCWCICIQIT